MEQAEIKIIDLDEEKTARPDSGKDVYDCYLTLSSEAPAEWAKLFEQRRQFPRHTSWRRAYAEGPYIVIRCALEELPRHLEDLKEDVAITNQQYRQYLAKREQEEEERRQREARERERVKEIKRRLQF